MLIHNPEHVNHSSLQVKVCFKWLIWEVGSDALCAGAENDRIQYQCVLFMESRKAGVCFLLSWCNGLSDIPFQISLMTLYCFKPSSISMPVTKSCLRQE